MFTDVSEEGGSQGSRHRNFLNLFQISVFDTESVIFSQSDVERSHTKHLASGYRASAV